VKNGERWKAQIALVSDALQNNVKKVRLLEQLAWPDAVEQQFFAKKANALPKVVYDLDRDGIATRIDTLVEIQKRIDGDDEIAEWLRGTVQSFIDGNRMLLALGTNEFYRMNREVYGGARTRFAGGALRNVDLAEHLFQRLAVHGWDEARDPDVPPIDARTFASQLQSKIAAREPAMDLEIEVTESCTAKVVAGMKRVRVRADATFMPWEVDDLWVHEVETHALSANNGALQPLAPFLSAGGPRSTRAQEGLATFSELYHHALSTERLQRLATRVRLVEMAEDGADFLQLYRYLIDHGSTPQNAYFDAQRVCRGGRVEGGAPCTKDVVYLGGLIDVWSFLTAVIRGGHRDEAELLVCGRIALEDMPALVQLRHAGVLERPRYLPDWLTHWRTLLPHFAFTSFASELDLANLEARFAKIISLAGEQKPPRSSRPT
jgi:uncharacterized protein (TIGR02421 family)